MLRVLSILLASCTLLLVLIAPAQTIDTGAVIGRVHHQDEPIAGATVEIQSTAGATLRRQVSDERGSFRIDFLHPGDYTVHVSRPPMFAAAVQRVVIRATRAATVTIALQPAASEEVTVVGTPPLIDMRSTLNGLNLTREAIEKLPLRREFSAVAQAAPGVLVDGAGPAFRGSTGWENQYVTEGLNTTGTQTADEVSTFNTDFVQEVEVMTGGLPAEYGRTTGGIISVVVRPGSNALTGSVFGFAAGGDLRSDLSYTDRVSTDYTSVSNVDRDFDYGVSMSGPIVTDRIWFFGGWNAITKRDSRIRLRTPVDVPGYFLPAGGRLPLGIDRDFVVGKMTATLTLRQTLSATVVHDARTESGAILAISGPPSTFEGTYATGGTDFVARYSAMPAASWSVNTSAGRHEDGNRVTGEGTRLPLTIDLSRTPARRTGGFGRIPTNEIHRDVARADIVHIRGNHTLKGGADVERVRGRFRTAMSGGDLVRVQCRGALVSGACPSDRIYYQHEVFVNELSPTFVRGDFSSYLANVTDAVTNLLMSRNTSFYLQDSWTRANVTLNVGLRWERQQLRNQRATRGIDIDDNVAPRLGLTWDLSGRGRSKIYAFAGRYHEAIPQIVNGYLSGPTTLRVRNLDPIPGNLDPHTSPPAFPTGDRYLLVTPSTTPVDPHLKGPHLDEILVGYELQTGRDVVVGLQATHRKLGRAIDASILPPGQLVIINPGEGIGKAIYSVLNRTSSVIARPNRTHDAIELRTSKRFDGRAQMLASYVWSRTRGNYEGLYSSLAGVPHDSISFEFAEQLVNTGGLLEQDREHQFKFHGSYALPGGVTAGVAAHWYSGQPLAAFGFSNFYFYQVYLLTRRGDLGRSGADYEADLHLSYPIRVRRGRLDLVLDVFNVLDRQAALTVDQRFNFAACAGVPAQICSADGGILGDPKTGVALGTIPAPRSSTTNPDFLQAGVTFSDPRAIRLGARFSF